MTKVGVKELKAHLSEYLDRVRAGESVVITLRGQDIATLAPISVSPGLAALQDLALEQGSYWRPRKWEFAPPAIAIRGRPIADTVLEDRGDPLP